MVDGACRGLVLLGALPSSTSGTAALRRFPGDGRLASIVESASERRSFRVCNLPSSRRPPGLRPHGRPCSVSMPSRLRVGRVRRVQPLTTQELANRAGVVHTSAFLAIGTGLGTRYGTDGEALSPAAHRVHDARRVLSPARTRLPAKLDLGGAPSGAQSRRRRGCRCHSRSIRGATIGG